MLTEQYNNFIINNLKISTHEFSILKSLESFYNSKTNYTKILDFLSIINTSSIVSIRLIDYFITQYVKNNKLNYIDNEISPNTINIYISYKQQLKIYQKKYFDPFSRGNRIPYFIHDKCIITTIGQLNFFKWLLSNNIFTYIINNKEHLEFTMLEKYKSNIKHKKKISKPIYKYSKNYNLNTNIGNYSSYIYNFKTLQKLDNIIVTF